MKKAILVGILLIGLVLISGCANTTGQAITNQQKVINVDSDIMCTCGCNIAVKDCECPTAKAMLSN